MGNGRRIEKIKARNGTIITALSDHNRKDACETFRHEIRLKYPKYPPSAIAIAVAPCTLIETVGLSAIWANLTNTLLGMIWGKVLAIAPKLNLLLSVMYPVTDISRDVGL